MGIYCTSTGDSVGCQHHMRALSLSCPSPPATRHPSQAGPARPYPMPSGSGPEACAACPARLPAGLDWSLLRTGHATTLPRCHAAMLPRWAGSLTRRSDHFAIPARCLRPLR